MAIIRKKKPTATYEDGQWRCSCKKGQRGCGWFMYGETTATVEIAEDGRHIEVVKYRDKGLQVGPLCYGCHQQFNPKETT